MVIVIESIEEREAWRLGVGITQYWLGELVHLRKLETRVAG